MEYQDHRLTKLVAEAAHGFHHVGGVVNIQVVGGLVKQHVLRVLGDHHGDVGPLALAAGELVDKTVLETAQLHVVHGLVDHGLVLFRQAAAGVGKTAEGHQLPDSELHLDVVALGQNCQPLGQLPVVPLADVLAAEVHHAAVPGN